MSFVLMIKSNRITRGLIFSSFFFLLLFILLNFIFPLPEYKIKKDYSTVHMDRNGEILRVSLSDSDKYRIKLPLEEISQYLQDGIIEYEDKFYYFHPGVNPVSIGRALILNLKNKRIISGASTITMQIARMINRRPRTIASKLIEVFRAFQLEFSFSKKELLEIYLNTIPMGGNLEGVGAGAYYYFGKSARELSFFESIILINIPKSPNRNRPDFFPAAAKKNIHSIILRLKNEFEISRDQILSYMGKDLNLKLNKFPFRCPHLVESGKKNNNIFFKHYTIDLSLQTFCENIFKDYSQQNRRQGIYNGSIIVVNNRTREVIAYVGSPDYFDKDHCGQINGAAISRSPGSALKPFLYAQAFEKGIITPEKILYDIPIQDRDYSPGNYNKSSLGLVTTRYALVHSLNIPAVRLENELQEEGLSLFLKDIYPMKQDKLIEKSGLSLVLGSFPLKLEEMINLYVMLANDGIYEPVHYFVDDPNVYAPRKLFSKESSFIVSEILSDCHRPDLPFNWEFTPYRSKVALKTGTSFGLRDAWCFGYNPEYTVGVWQGNADNKYSSNLIGIQKAAPLMIKIFDHVAVNSNSWFKKPETVSTRKVCAKSGDKFGKYCSQYKIDYYLPGISSEKNCIVHKLIYISKKNNKYVCSYCMKGPDFQYKKRIIEKWPNHVISYLRKNGFNYSKIPEHNEECTNNFQKNKPRIVQPVPNAEYQIDQTLPFHNQKIPLRVFAAQDAEKIYWFIGDELINEVSPDEICFISPRKGKWIISAIDSRGRSDSVSISIY